MARYGLDLQRKGKNKKRRTVTLVIAFLCFALVVGSVSFLLLWRSLDFDFGNIFKKDDESTTTEQTTEPTTAQTFTGEYVFLAAVTSDDGKETRYINLISVNLGEKTIRIVPVDATEKPDGSKKTFADILVSNGPKELEGYLAPKYSCEISRYAVFTESGYKGVFRALGNFTVTLKNDVEYDTKDMFLELKKGENTMTPEKAFKYMKYLSERFTGYEASQLNAELGVAAFDSFMTLTEFSKADSLFNSIINNCNSDITIVDFTSANEEINSLIPKSSKEKLKVFVSKTVRENADEEEIR